LIRQVNIFLFTLRNYHPTIRRTWFFARRININSL